jgi:hypothetical protein
VCRDKQWCARRWATTGAAEPSPTHSHAHKRRHDWIPGEEEWGTVKGRAGPGPCSAGGWNARSMHASRLSKSSLAAGPVVCGLYMHYVGPQPCILPVNQCTLGGTVGRVAHRPRNAHQRNFHNSIDCSTLTLGLLRVQWCFLSYRWLLVRTAQARLRWWPPAMHMGVQDVTMVSINTAALLIWEVSSAPTAVSKSLQRSCQRTGVCSGSLLLRICQRRSS